MSREAMQMAQPEQKCAHEIDQKECDWCKPAQPEQEPVAWASSLDFDDDDAEIIPAKAKGKLGTSNCDIPLYTAPPISDYHEGWEEGFKAAKREWVGLTGDEARKFYEKYTDREELIHAIDAFLEEKNT